MNRFLLGLSVAACVFAFNSCGNSSSGGGKRHSPNQGNGEANLGGGDGQTPMNCADLWAGYVKGNPQGRVLEYDETTERRMPGLPNTSPASVSHTKESVIESNNDRVTTRRENSSGSNDDTMTREQFMTYCRPGTTGTHTGTGQATVQEQHAERITVKAGSFDTQYVKTNFSAGMMNGTAETWTVNEGMASFIVKSVTTSSQTSAGYKIDTVITKELTRLVRP